MEQKIFIGQFREEQVCSENIMSIFLDSYYNAVLNDEYIIVTDEYNVMIRIDQKNKFISFAIYFEIEDSFDKSDLYRSVAHANDKIAFVKCCIDDDDGDIYTEYYISYTGGVLASNIINSFRKFVVTTKSAMKSLYEDLKNG
jgi:hypothetical protein